MVGKDTLREIYKKCGIALPPQPTNRAIELVAEIRKATTTLDIMVLCDKLTDELTGRDTNGFRVK